MEDISGGQERVRIPLVNDTPDTPDPPAFTYRPTNSVSRSAALCLGELHRRRLVQWAGSALTDAADGTAALPDFTSHFSVGYHPVHLVLDRIQFTPCMEDAPGGPAALPACVIPARLSLHRACVACCLAARRLRMSSL